MSARSSPAWPEARHHPKRLDRRERLPRRAVRFGRDTRPPRAAVVRLLTREEITALVRAAHGRRAAAGRRREPVRRAQRGPRPGRRRAARTRVSAIARNARWKLNTGAVQVRGTRLEELQNVRGVSYIEPGQTLRGPEPAVGGIVKKPDAALRRVSAQARRHGYGRDVLVGIIDVGGFDFAHPDFLAAGGKTRFGRDLGPGRRRGRRPRARRNRFASLDYGAEITKEHMDRAIARAPGSAMAAPSLEPQSRWSGLARHARRLDRRRQPRRRPQRADSPASSSRCARRTRSIVVELLRLDAASPHAVDYLIGARGRARRRDGPLPVAINISLGTNGHAHDTSSAMARWIDNALATPGRCVTVAAGNAGQDRADVAARRRPLMGRIHAERHDRRDRASRRTSVGRGRMARSDVSENEMEIWYGPQDRISVEVRPPGRRVDRSPSRPASTSRNRGARQRDRAEHPQRDVSPRQRREPDLDRAEPVLRPGRGGERQIGPIAGGEWQVRLTGTVIRDGRYDAWIERDDPRRVGRFGRARGWRYPSFFAPGSYTDDRMISSLACAERILAVAQRRRRPQCGPRHVEPRPDARRPLQARRRRRRHGHRRRPRARGRASRGSR